MVELRVLGTLQISASDERDVKPLVHQAKRAALLAYLAAAVPRGMQRRDKLLALFWPELDDARARAALSQALYVLRATLGEQAVTPRADGAVGLNSDVVWCDAAAFETALDTGRPAEALTLYRGDLLDGFFISDALEFERWLDGERARLRQRASAGAWALAEAKVAEGDAFEATRWAKRAADLAPADEAVMRRLMRFLHELGDRAAAIRAYETFVARLRQDYELEPSAETVALADAIRQAERLPSPRVIEGPPPPSDTGVALAARKRRWWAAAGAVVAAAAGAWAWLARGPTHPPVVRFTLEFPDAQPIPGGVAGSTVTLSPDGTRLVYLGGSVEANQLYLRPLDRLDASPIPHTRDARYPFFSPDGAWLGFEVAGSIRKVPLAGGPAITVFRAETDVLGVSWGARGLIVFATGSALWQVSAGGSEARIVAVADTTRGEVYRWPEVLPDGGAAVFTIQRDARFQLAAADLETGAVRPLGLEGTDPRFVRPGYLVFSRLDGVVLAAPFDPRTLNVTGGAVPITEGVAVGVAGGANLGVSKAGALAYVAGLEDRELVLVDRAGRAEPLPVPPHRFHAARFSPTGRRIVTSVSFAGRELRDLWVLDVAESSFTRVTFDSATVHATWMPDGERIVVQTRLPGWPPGFSLRGVRTDGSGAALTLLPAAQGQSPQGVTSDGRTLVFLRRHPVTGRDIWTLALDPGSAPQPYLRGPADEYAAALSPDGRWLAYVSNESGREEVYVRAFPNPGPAWPVSVGGGREPRWVPSGRELFYRNDDGLVAAAVGASSSFRVRRREVLFDDDAYALSGTSAAYDVHPDGRRFLMIRRGSEKLQVVVVLNWFDQLRAASARGRKLP